jgi:filamentous hemagglutinin
MNERLVDPNTLRFSQRTAGGNGRAAMLRESMGAQGWNGPPIDVVETAAGLVTIDNTRVAVVQELGIAEIPVAVHAPDETLPESLRGRFPDAETWGDALAYRTGRQTPPLPVGGTLTRPRMPAE